MYATAKRPRIVISTNTSWNIVNFRLGLIRGLRDADCEVIAIAPKDAHTPQIEENGFEVVSIPMDNGGTNPFNDSALLARYVRRLRRIKPDLYLGYTIKPNVYGSLACRFLSIPTINNVSGLGTVFLKPGPMQHVVQHLYKTSLAQSRRVFFQNDDDLKYFVQRGLVRREQTGLLPGSGVDLRHFVPATAPQRRSPQQPFQFLFIGRILRDKGIVEYVEAARALRAEGVTADFAILGFLDVQNPSTIGREIMDEWSEEGIVDYLGVSDDVRPHLAVADCVVLPSYYPEGTPRSLLEAAAMAKPIITTDRPGCRNTIDDGITGFLCEPKSVADLTSKMRAMLALPTEYRAAMGRAGRAKMEREFDEQVVLRHYLDAIISANRPIIE